MRGREPAGGSALGSAQFATTTAACQSSCAAKDGCEWWVLRNSTVSAAAGGGLTCELIGSAMASPRISVMKGFCPTNSLMPSSLILLGSSGIVGLGLLAGAGSTGAKDCASASCEMGPKDCPGMGDGGSPAALSEKAMTAATVRALVDSATVGPPSTARYDLEGGHVMEELARLDDKGYFNGNRALY